VGDSKGWPKQKEAKELAQHETTVPAKNSQNRLFIFCTTTQINELPNLNFENHRDGVQAVIRVAISTRRKALENKDKHRPIRAGHPISLEVDTACRRYRLVMDVFGKDPMPDTYVLAARFDDCRIETSCGDVARNVHIQNHFEIALNSTKGGIGDGDTADIKLCRKPAQHPGRQLVPYYNLLSPPLRSLWRMR
jgi:hypothetical protein